MSRPDKRWCKWSVGDEFESVESRSTEAYVLLCLERDGACRNDNGRKKCKSPQRGFYETDPAFLDQRHGAEIRQGAAVRFSILHQYADIHPLTPLRLEQLFARLAIITSI